MMAGASGHGARYGYRRGMGVALSEYEARMLNAMAAKWPPAPVDVECVDVWPPGCLSDARKRAYDAICRRGRLNPHAVTKDDSGRIYVRYSADVPHEWILAEMSAERAAIEANAEQVTIDMKG